jgi:hypothetical protein
MFFSPAVLAPCIFHTLPLVVPVVRSLINTVFFTKRHFPSQFVHKNVIAGTACVERNITGLTLWTALQRKRRPEIWFTFRRHLLEISETCAFFSLVSTIIETGYPDKSPAKLQTSLEGVCLYLPFLNFFFPLSVGWPFELFKHNSAGWGRWAVGVGSGVWSVGSGFPFANRTIIGVSR